jgi:RimJ/RimL family protein N-acetyltransferase
VQLVALNAERAPQLETLFAGDRPIPIRLWAILDGTIESRILVDQPTKPTLALVQELAQGTTYIGGVVTPQALANAFDQLRQYQEIVVCLWPDDDLSSILPPAPQYEGTAIDFTNRSPAIDLSQLAALPANYHLRRIDAEIVPALAGFDYYIAMYGSVERAVQNTIGYCLMHGKAVACEAVAGPLTRGIAEIGVGTAEANRRQGFATITCARVIQECEALGYRAFWNASQHNSASIALAKRLGFQTERPFKVLAWSATGPAIAPEPM